MDVDSASPVFRLRLRPFVADQSMSTRPVVRCRATAAKQPVPRLKLRRSFDRAAASFDSVAALPREIAARMTERLLLVQLPARRILDAGCGTGAAAALLRQRFTGALVIELDASEEMLRQRATRPKPGWFRIGRQSTRLAVCDIFAAGLGSPALRLARMPAATFQTGPEPQQRPNFEAPRIFLTHSVRRCRCESQTRAPTGIPFSQPSTPTNRVATGGVAALALPAITRPSPPTSGLQRCRRPLMAAKLFERRRAVAGLACHHVTHCSIPSNRRP